MKKRLIGILLTAALVSGVLTGCGKPSGSSQTSAAPAAGETKAQVETTAQAAAAAQASETSAQAEAANDEEITITYAQSSDIVGWDPRNALSTFTAAMMYNVYSSLVRTNEEFEVVPDLAESWEAVDDRTYRFHLHQGVKFHNGEDLTAEDIKYTIDTLHEEDKEWNLKADFTFFNCEVEDDYTLLIKTEEPNPSTLRRLTYVKIIPKDYVEEVGNEEFEKHPVGSGPYKFVKWEKDAVIELEAFDDYFGGKREIDHLICKIIPEASGRIAALEAGEVDLISNVTPTQLGRLETLGNIAVESKPSTRSVYFTFNSFAEGSPVQDLKVRQAMNMAIDNKTIVASVLDGYGAAAEQLPIPLYDGYDDSIEGYPYDPDGARALLAEAGYPDGFDLEIGGFFTDLLNGSDVVQAVAAQLNEVGIRTTIYEEDNNTTRSKYGNKTTYPLTFFSWGGPYIDMELIMRCVLGTGQRASAWSTPECDELLHKLATVPGPDTDQEVYTAIQQYAFENACVIPMYRAAQTYAYNKDKLEWSPRTDELMVLIDAKPVK
ncbi:MAG: ABC transporter substrate-binding protein [Lachnospiraceae bacterium]|nr:ABC transporter substrate-binding protein [Lachnospiraceae bacterium]